MANEDFDFVWLENPTTGGKNQFPRDAVAAWRARGWVDTDPEPDPSIWRDSPEAIAEAEAESQALRPQPPVTPSLPDPAEKPLVFNPGADASTGAPEEPLPVEMTDADAAPRAGRKSTTKATEEN